MWWQPTNDSAGLLRSYPVIDGRPDGQIHRARRILDIDHGHRSVHSAKTGVTNSAGNDLGSTNSGQVSFGSISGHDAIGAWQLANSSRNCPGAVSEPHGFI
jgi:hypothetical protein